MSEKASPFRKAAGRSAIGALQPVAEHAAYGRRCPEAAVPRPRAKKGGTRSIVAPPLVGRMLFQPFTAARSQVPKAG